MLKDNNVFISLIMLIMLCAACTVYAEDLLKAPFNWQTSCEERKSSFLSDTRLEITFSKSPQTDNINNYWVLKWNGINSTLPPVNFKDVYVSKGLKNLYEILLRSEDGITVQLLVMDNTPAKDVFAVSEVGGSEIKLSSYGIALTKAMFGGPVSNAELIMLGYETTPKDLTCLKESWVKESAKIVALTLKSISGPGELISVYKGVGTDKGWIEKKRSGEFIRYALNIITEETPDLIYQISYQIPKNSSYHSLPFMAGRTKNLIANQLPEWLTALSTALKSNSEDSWKIYISAAKKEGISEKSILRVIKNLKLEKQP